MIAKGDGKTTNAYVAAQQSIMVGGLSSVYPKEAAPSDAVHLRILGGYEISYSKQPSVKLRNNDGVYEGQWMVDKNFDQRSLISADDMPMAIFDLRNAKVGKYDVIVGTDTLYQAFEVVKGEGYPDVWFEVSGRDKMLWGKYQIYSIDFGNKSNVAAYNTPFTLFVSDMEGKLDLSFDFPVSIYSDDIPQTVRDLLKEGENGVVYNTPQYGPMRCYMLNIPYIAPNGEGHLTFRIRVKDDNGLAPGSGIHMVYAYGLPVGAYEEERVANAVRRKAQEADEWDDLLNVHDRWDGELAACLGDYLYGWFKDTALGAIPGVGCIHAQAKYEASKKETHDWAVANMMVNGIGAAISCVGTVVDVGTLGGTWIFHATVEAIWNGISNAVSVASCLAQSKKYRHLVPVRSYDPNEMIGPAGPDDQRHYIKPINQMPYTITFENKASATAPANEVFVTDTLDLSKFDAETFSFSGFGWADNAYTVGGSDNKEFTRDVQYQVNGHDILVRVSGQFDQQTGIARWSFVSLEKNGNELDDIMNGFLLPNNDNGVGEGFVSFSIQHKKNPANKSTVSNKATIVFDANAPIVTNTYVNTFDTDYPTSKITSVRESDGNLLITVQGSDATSGISHYGIYAFINGSEEAELLATVTDGSSVSIPCQPGTHYALCSIATDNVGWNEPKDMKTEAEITTTGEGPGPNEKTTTVSVSAEGYATFYDSQDNYQLPSGLSAYVVTEANGSTLQSQPIGGSIIPKGVPVYLSAREKRAATYTLTATEDNASYNGSNMLHGSDAATTTTAQGDNLYYKLAYGPSDTPLQNLFGWFWGAANGAAFRIDAHRAWLAVPRTRATRGYIFGDDETGIGQAVADDEEQEVQLYDMQGRPVGGNPKKGLYIRNNKKVFIK